VIEGIPIIFRNPAVVALATNAPLDLLALPVDTQHALVQGLPPDHDLAQHFSRLARYLWAGFGDLAETPEDNLAPQPIHALDVVAWLLALGEEEVMAGGQLRLIAGGALGRELWAFKAGATVLMEAHLPSLLAARRLMREGELSIVAPESTLSWVSTRWQAPGDVQIPVGMVCCDALDPPFSGDQFASILALNLVDSVHDPALMLGQSHAMLASGGLLTVTSPFTWRTNVTPAERWLERSMGAFTPADAMHTMVTQRLDPPMHIRGQRDFVWSLRSSRHEAMVYRSKGWCLEKP